MLTGWSCTCSSLSFTLLPAAAAAASTAIASYPPPSSRDGPSPRTRNFRNPRSLRSGGLCGELYHWRCAASAQPPPPPPPPPDFGGGDGSSSGSLSRFQEELSKIQDRVRIFFAVLFWMSLFFWASAWDGSDDPRNKKGPRFGKRFK